MDILLGKSEDKEDPNQEGAKPKSWVKHQNTPNQYVELGKIMSARNVSPLLT